MVICNITKKEEIVECVDMYIKQNDFSFLDVSRKVAIANLDLATRRHKFIKILKDDNQIVAWIFANDLGSLHLNHKGLQQLYYCSILKGTAAYRAIKLLHQELINYAIANEYDLIVSPGSHLDEKQVFTKILEKIGWERRGHLALYKTKYYRSTNVTE
jgi:hypothetical protein